MKPLPVNNALFFWLENRRQPMHVGSLHLYQPPPGADAGFARRLVDDLRRFTSARPPFNQRAVLKLGHYFWEEDEQFDLDYHLRHSALPQPGRIRELLALVSRLHGTAMDRSRPLWELHLIEGLADGRVAVYVKAHHAMMDGVAAAKLIESSLSETAGPAKAPFWTVDPPRRRSAPEQQESLVQKALGGLRAAAEVLPGVKSGLQEVLRSGRSHPADATPFQAPPTIFNVEVSSSRRFAAQSYSLRRIKALGKAAGATVNDVTLAMCAGALREYLLAHDALPDRPLIAMVPVSVRTSDEQEGNQVGVLMANLATHVADPAERLRLIVESTSRAKAQLSTMSRLEALAHAGAMTSPLMPSAVTGHARRRPIFNLVISNVPGPKKPLYFDHARLDELYPVSIPCDYLALNITLMSYGDHLGFGFIACRRAVTGLQRLLDYTEHALVELERAFDVPEAKRAG